VGTLTAFGGRWFLLYTGRLSDETAGRLSSLTVAALLAATLFFSAAAVASRKLANTQPVQTPPAVTTGSGPVKDGAVTTAVAILALATAAYGMVELLSPITPYQAAAPACRNAPVAGASFLAQTVGTGVNGRAGPSSGYPQVDRFAGNCTLGFDGFCIGEPVHDFLILKPLDQRWLVLHRRTIFVASGKILSQSPEKTLGAHPSPRCTTLGGLPEPRIDELHVVPALPLSQLSVRTSGAVIAVGYAVNISGPSAMIVDPFGQIGIKTRDEGFTASWNPALAATMLPAGSGTVEVAATACLAPGVHGDVRVVRITLTHSLPDSQGTPLQVDAATRDHLGSTACEAGGK
jgi:hypothetical protein